VSTEIRAYLVAVVVVITAPRVSAAQGNNCKCDNEKMSPPLRPCQPSGAI